MPSPNVHRRSRLAASLLFLGVTSFAVLAPAPARAGSPPSLTAQSEAQARFQTGLRYYDARDFESARLAFTQAYAVLQKPGILLNLALSELYTDRPLDALEHLDRYLAETDLPNDKRERAKKAHDEAFKKVGHIAVTVLPGTDVKIDGAPKTPLPALVHVAAGTHAVEGARGSATKSVTVEARAGETTTVDLRLTEDAAAVASAGAPATPRREEAPSARIAAEAPSIAEEGSTTVLGWRSITGLALVGAGAVTLAFGFAARGDAAAASDRVASLSASVPSGPSGCATSPSAACSDLAQSVRDRNDAASRRDVLFVAGGAAVAVGAGFVASAFLWPHRKTQAARLGPGPTALGLSFSTSY